MGLGRVKTQRRANCREKYSFESPLCEREEQTELRRGRICEADSLPFARFHVFTRPGSNSEFGARNWASPIDPQNTVLKKSKIEGLRKSRESRMLAISTAAGLCRTDTRGQPLLFRCLVDVIPHIAARETHGRS